MIYDIGREHELKKWGIKILRFKNDEVIEDIDSVVDKILNEIISIKSSSSQ
jgi:very-short-patch-repair endonuclease